MAKAPTTLPEALEALDRLEKVVDRLASKLDKLADEDVHELKAKVDKRQRVTRSRPIDPDIRASASPMRRQAPGTIKVRVRGRVVERVNNPR
jgi:predicted RecB family endonuclease